MRPKRALGALALAAALTPALLALACTSADSPRAEEPRSPATDCPPDAPGCEDVIDEAVTGSNDQHLAAIATNDLAERLGIEAEEVAVVAVFERDWSDACLGVHYPDQLCAQVITPGFVVILSAAGGEYRYHTDAVDRVIATDFAEGAEIDRSDDGGYADEPVKETEE